MLWVWSDAVQVYRSDAIAGASFSLFTFVFQNF